MTTARQDFTRDRDNKWLDDLRALDSYLLHKKYQRDIPIGLPLKAAEGDFHYLTCHYVIP